MAPVSWESLNVGENPVIFHIRIIIIKFLYFVVEDRQCNFLCGTKLGGGGKNWEGRKKLGGVGKNWWLNVPMLLTLIAPV